MNKSESIAKLAVAMVKAQTQVGIAIKNAINPHLKNKYADLGAVWDAIAPAMKEYDLAVVQMPAPSDDGRLHLETVLLHESGEWLSNVMVMPLAKQDPQGYGAALTYARRYALAALMGVTQDDDDGARAVASQKQEIAYDWTQRIGECGSEDELKSMFTEAIKAVGGDNSARSIIITAKDAKKKELMNGTAQH